MLPVLAKMSDCLRREHKFSPKNLTRPPTLPNHMIFGVMSPYNKQTSLQKKWSETVN
jgi:hypothetical protein